MSAAQPIQSERTTIGEQMLVPGVRPVPLRERLEARMTGALQPRRAQRPIDIGLFDEVARAQLDLFGTGGRASRNPEFPPGGG